MRGDHNQDGEGMPLLQRERLDESQAGVNVDPILDPYFADDTLEIDRINLTAFVIKSIFSMFSELTPVVTGGSKDMPRWLLYFYVCTIASVKISHMTSTRLEAMRSKTLDRDKQYERGNRSYASMVLKRYLAISSTFLLPLYPALILANGEVLYPHTHSGDFPIGEIEFWSVMGVGAIAQSVVIYYVWWPYSGREANKCLKAFSYVIKRFHEDRVRYALVLSIGLINAIVNAARAGYVWHVALTGYATRGQGFDMSCLSPDQQRALSITSMVVMVVVGGQHVILDLGRTVDLVCRRQQQGLVGRLSVPAFLLALIYAINDFWSTYIAIATLASHHQSYVQSNCTELAGHHSTHAPANAWVLLLCLVGAFSYTVVSFAFSWGTRPEFHATPGGWSVGRVASSVYGIFGCCKAKTDAIRVQGVAAIGHGTDASRRGPMTSL